MKANMNKKTKIYVTVKINDVLTSKVFKTIMRAEKYIGRSAAIAMRVSLYGYTSETCGRYLYKEGNRCSFNRGFTAEMYYRWNNWSQS